MKEVFRFKELDYVIRYPEGFRKMPAEGAAGAISEVSAENKENVTQYPLVLYMHGAGGRGRNIDLIYNHPFFTETEGFHFPVISVAPQCYEDSWFSIFEQLQEFVRYMIDQPYVDKAKVYLIGASMGGYTTWQLAMSRPELFAAIVPICGGGMYWNAARFIGMGVWAFHGAEDPIVNPDESRKMVASINEKGGKASLTIYEGVPHDAWTPTFRDPEMWKWMFAHENTYLSQRTE